MTPQPGEALRERIYETLMQRGVWPLHLRGGHAGDASKHAAALADLLAAALSDAAAPVAGEGLDVRIRTLLADTEAGIVRAEANGPNDPNGRYPCWGTVTTERKAFAENLRAALAANQPVTEERSTP